MLATLEFPDVDGPVIAATRQHTSIGTDLESLHDPLMCLSHQHTLSALDLPPTQPPVTASTEQHPTTRGQQPAIGAPCHTPDSPMMSRQPQQLYAIRGVPHIDDAIIASTD